MTPVRSLRLGDSVTVDGVSTTVTAITGNTVVLTTVDGDRQAWHLPQLLESASLHQAVLRPLHRVRTIDESSDPAHREAVELADHIREATTGQPINGGRPRAEFDPEVTSQDERDRLKVTELRSRGNEISLRTFQRRRAAYAKHGLYGLVDARTRPSQGHNRTDQRVIDTLVSCLNARANDSTRSKQWVIDNVTQRLVNRYGDDAPPMPSTATMYRLIDSYSNGAATFGEAPTRRSIASAPKGTLRRTQGYRPGERIEIDSTRADMLVIGPDGRDFRPELTIAVDTATRTICAASLEHSTNSTDLSLLLAEMIAPVRCHPNWPDHCRVRHRTVPEKLRLTDLETRLRAHLEHPVIVPETIVTDIGPPYRSKHFRRACELLGVSFEPTRPGRPTDKPTVEKLIQTVNTQFCQYQPGYTGRNSAHRGRHVKAALTLDQAQDLLDEWVATEWQRRPNYGLRTEWGNPRLSPNAMYNHFVAFTGELRLPLTADTYIELLPAKRVAVHRYGINHDRRIYDSPSLDNLRQRRAPDPAGGGKWEIHYNPRNIFHVWLRGPDGWIQAEWNHAPLFHQPFGAQLWAQAKKQAPDTRHETISRTALELQQTLAGRSAAALRQSRHECGNETASHDDRLPRPQLPVSTMTNFDPSEWPQ